MAPVRSHACHHALPNHCCHSQTTFRDTLDSSILVQNINVICLIIACVPVQCTFQAFPYPFGAPATPFAVSAAVRRSPRHRRSSGYRAGSRQLQEAGSVFGPCDARGRPILQQAAPHSQYEVGRTDPSTQDTSPALHCVCATESLGHTRHSRRHPAMYGFCRCPAVWPYERLQSRVGVAVSPYLPVDVCRASSFKPPLPPASFCLVGIGLLLLPNARNHSYM